MSGIALARATSLGLACALAIASCGQQASVPASQPPANSARSDVEATLARFQRAVQHHDVATICELLIPSSDTQSPSPTQADSAATRQRLEAATEDCKSSFGRHGEFSALQGLDRLTIKGVTIRGITATARVVTSRGQKDLGLLRLSGKWRLLLRQS